jgi:rhomboid protease GluP
MANCAQCGRKLPGLSFGKKLCQWCVEYQAIQRGEVVESKQRVMPAPWVRHAESTIGVTNIILGINAAVFLAMCVQLAIGKAPEGSSIMNFGAQIALWGDNVGALTLSGEWWRLVTNVFVHGGLFHFAFNMWALWNLGQLCESLYGRWTYTTIYLVCGLGASLASASWHPYVHSVGASGAIFGLAGALLASFKLGEFSLPRSALSGTLRSLGAFVVYSLLFGFLPGIDNTAHIGGLITGLIVGALIALLAPRMEQTPRRVLLFVAVTLVLVGVAFAVTHYYGLPLRFGRSPFAVEN